MGKEHLYQHFRTEEGYLVDHLLDLIARVETFYAFEITEFLNPRQVAIARSLVANSGLKCFVSSDYLPSEYARVIIAPHYYECDWSDFQISLVAISYNGKFNQLSHAQILGTLLNQLGLKRQMLGDILVASGQAQVFVDRSMVSYLLNHVTRIARVTVSLTEVPPFDNIVPTLDSHRQVILTSSLRLDKVVAEVLRLSRSKVLRLIETEKVKLNYAVTTKASDQLFMGDMVSIRGFGRFKLLDDDGLTKKDKHKLVIERLIHQ